MKSEERSSTQDLFKALTSWEVKGGTTSETGRKPLLGKTSLQQSSTPRTKKMENEITNQADAIEVGMARANDLISELEDRLMKVSVLEEADPLAVDQADPKPVLETELGQQLANQAQAVENIIGRLSSIIVSLRL